jgi:hypothetical protein
MRTAGNLSILVLTLLFVALALVAETREITREITPRAGVAAPLASDETSSDQNVRPFPRPGRTVDPSISGRDEAEGEKIFAWLLLLLKERRGAR